MVPQQVSFVERSSLSQRVPYRRFHCILQLGTPVKRPASVKTPVKKEGCGVGMGVAETSQVSLGVADEVYAVVDCESSVTALEMVQLRLDKQGDYVLANTGS